MPCISDCHSNDFRNIVRRRIRPALLISRGVSLSTYKGVEYAGSERATDVDDLNSVWHDVQGDVFMLLPKCAENFIFFVITDTAQFKNDLKSYKPSSSFDVVETLKDISRSKDAGQHLPLALNQIAFSRAGLNALGYTTNIEDAYFDSRPTGMLTHKSLLGDQSPWFSPFKDGGLHGIFTVAASCEKEVEEESRRIKALFENSITSSEKMTLKGRVRPAPYRGHEHFGYKDGVSQPSLRGLTWPHKGQLQADPGVIIMGYKGDPVYDEPDAQQRPVWTKGGSIMVFRQLEQDVVGFEKYINQRGKNWRKYVHDPKAVQPPLSDTEGAELFGAQIIGRWKSGTPLAKCPYRDDLSMAKNLDAVNDFDYSVPGTKEPTARLCPFTAHTRKTAPRNLGPYINRSYLESSVIVRGGIPYGPEVTKEERDAGESSREEAKLRGTFFICYQSSLENGFIRQTVGFAGNDYFPPVSLVPVRHGQDAILGSPSPKPTIVNVDDKDVHVPIDGNSEVILRLRTQTEDVAVVTGFAKPPLSAQAEEMEFFVSSRGGEYFFVPPVSFVREIADDKSMLSHKLDLVFLQDATGSQQEYIDCVRDKINTICDRITNGTEQFDKRLDVRFGLIAFRDYDGQEELIENYGFTPSPKVMKDNLEKLRTIGGGDGPEAQNVALNEALRMDWRKDAMKLVILVTDSPPHAIGERNDNHALAIPDGLDPVVLTDRMKSEGISLNVIACEPTLSGDYVYANDFYHGLVAKTGGKLVPLVQSDNLADCIIGCALQHADIESLVCKWGNVLKDEFVKVKDEDKLAEKVRDRCAAENIKINTLEVDDIYAHGAEKQILKNREVWCKAKNLAEGRKGQKRVTGSRLKEEFKGNSNCADQKVHIKLRVLSLCVAKLLVTKALLRA